MSILMEAQGVLDGPRQDTYGDPVETCARIGAAWGALLGIEPLKASTVASMMVVLKAVREEAGPSSHRDNWVDIAGYAEIGARGAEIAQVAAGIARDRVLAEELPPADAAHDFPDALVHPAREEGVSRGVSVPINVISLEERRSSFRGDARTCGCPYVGSGMCSTPQACTERFLEDVHRNGDGGGESA